MWIVCHGLLRLRECLKNNYKMLRCACWKKFRRALILIMHFSTVFKIKHLMFIPRFPICSLKVPLCTWKQVQSCTKTDTVLCRTVPCFLVLFLCVLNSHVSCVCTCCAIVLEEVFSHTLFVHIEFGQWLESQSCSWLLLPSVNSKCLYH